MTRRVGTNVDLFDGCSSCGQLRGGDNKCGCGTRRDTLTPEQLARHRANAVQLVSTGTVFTCDTCDHAPRCLYAFDAYNTDGDCLASK